MAGPLWGTIPWPVDWDNSHRVDPEINFYLNFFLARSRDEITACGLFLSVTLKRVLAESPQPSLPFHPLWAAGKRRRFADASYRSSENV